MSGWSIEKLLEGLHKDVESRLATLRKTLAHSVAKGDASESVWLELLREYMPKRYSVGRGFIVDSKGTFSEQIDVVIFDRQYTPIIFHFEGQTIIPAEGVYAVLEAKQSASAETLRYAQRKIESVRRLHRTSLPIPHAGGTYDAREPGPIIGGFLSFDSDWKPPLGEALKGALIEGLGDGAIDIGCIAAHGVFIRNGDEYELRETAVAATATLLELIAQLQALATVPMIDIREYAKQLPN